MKFRIDNIEYNLKEKQDFSWLNEYGTVFSCIDQTGSGCILFGVESKDKKLFVKIAGANTMYAEVSQMESVDLLKKAVENYKNIKHPNLIKLVDSFEKKDLYVAIFEWVDGECLFDHWNFEMYKQDSSIVTPAAKFNALDTSKKLDVIKKLFMFFIATKNAGFVAVDFYDSSIIYNFETDEVHFCDIDLFRKAPTYNDLGEGYFGTKRLKAPEENELGACIDEKTNMFTLGAIIFDMLSKKDNDNIKERYLKGHFIPCPFENFSLSKQSYDVLLKATSLNRNERFESLEEFFNAWENAR